MDRRIKGIGLQSANFNIPKIKNNETLQKVSLTSRDAQDLLKEVDHSFLDEKYKHHWKLASLEFVRSPHVEQLYRAKRSELKGDGRPLQEQVCFLSVNQKFLATKIAREGLRVRAQNHNTLGNSSQGVYLWKHIDPQLRTVEKGDAFILVFKVTPGRCKQVPPTNSSEVEPTPNYDCHISSLQPRPTDSVREQFRHTQIYLYEYTDDAEPSRQPRHCLPYALLQYCREDLAQKNEVSAYNVIKPSFVPSAGKLTADRRSSEAGRTTLAEAPKTEGEDGSVSKDKGSARLRPAPGPTQTTEDGFGLPAFRGVHSLHLVKPNASRENESRRVEMSREPDENSDDELDEQMKSIIRHPRIHRLSSSLLNVTRDPRLRRHSLETPKEIPLERVPEGVKDAGSDSSFEAKFSSSVMESMKKTVDRLLGRDNTLQQDAFQGEDNRKKVDEDPFNSWGLIWREESTMNQENMNKQPVSNCQTRIGSSPRAGTSPRAGSSPRAIEHSPSLSDRDVPAPFGNIVLDKRLTDSVLSASELAALVDMGAPATRAGLDHIAFAHPPWRTDGTRSGAVTRRLSSAGQHSADEDGEFVVLDEYQCSETDESDSHSDVGHTSPKVPGQASRPPMSSTPANILERFTTLDKVSQSHSHPRQSPFDAESEPSSDATNTRPLKSVLKKPGTDATKGKKKLSIGDYKRLKLKEREETRGKQEQMNSPATGYTSASSVDGASTDLASGMFLSSKPSSSSGPQVRDSFQGPVMAKSLPNAFAFLQSFASEAQTPVSVISEMTSEKDSGIKTPVAVSGVGKTSNAESTPGSKSSSKLGTGDTFQATSASVFQPTISFKRLSATLQGALSSRDPRMRSTQTPTLAEKLHLDENVDMAHSATDDGTTRSASGAACTQKSPLLDRLAKMCMPRPNSSHKGSPCHLSFDQSLPKESDESETIGTFQEPTNKTNVCSQSDEMPCQSHTVDCQLSTPDEGRKSSHARRKHAGGDKGENVENTAESLANSSHKFNEQEQDKAVSASEQVHTRLDEICRPAEFSKEEVSKNKADSKSSELGEPVQVCESPETRKPTETDDLIKQTKSLPAADDCLAKSATVSNISKENTALAKNESNADDINNVKPESVGDVPGEEDVTEDDDMEELAALVRIAKGLRPGPSSRGISPEASAHNSASSSAPSSKENSPDLSKLVLTGAVDFSTWDIQDDRSSLTGSEKSVASSKKSASSKSKQSKGRERRSNDTSPEPELPFPRNEEFEAMVRLAKGLRPGRRIQVGGLGKNPTDEPLPVLEGKGRSRTFKHRVKNASADQAGKGTSSETIPSDSDLQHQNQDKATRQKKKPRKRGGGKRKKRKPDNKNKPADRILTPGSRSAADEDIDYLDFQFDVPFSIISIDEDSRTGESTGRITPPTAHGVLPVSTKTEPRETETGTSPAEGKLKAPSTEREFRALPISTLGIRHWMEALAMKSLDPDVVLVDLVKAYLGGADFDNCSICQKVVDSTVIEDTPDDDLEADDECTPDDTGVQGNAAGSSELYAIAATSPDKIQDSVNINSAFVVKECPSEVPALAAKVDDVASSQETHTSQAAKESQSKHDQEIPSTSTDSNKALAPGSSEPLPVDHQCIIKNADIHAHAHADSTLLPRLTTCSSEPQAGRQWEEDSMVLASTSDVPAAKLSVSDRGAINAKREISPKHSTDKPCVDNISENAHLAASKLNLCHNQCGNETAPDSGSNEGDGITTPETADAHAVMHVNVADDIWSTGFWKHPDEIENVDVAQQDNETTQQGIPREITLDSRVKKRSHSADEADRSSLKRSKASQLSLEPTNPIQKSDIDERQKLAKGDRKQTLILHSQTSTKSCWQQWKNDQAAKSTRDNVDGGLQYDHTTSHVAEDLQDHDYRKGRERSPLFSAMVTPANAANVPIPPASADQPKQPQQLPLQANISSQGTKKSQQSHEQQASGSQRSSGSRSFTVRDFIVDKFNITDPESLAPHLPYKLTMEMSKLSKRQRQRLREHVAINLDQRPLDGVAMPAPTVLLETFPTDQIQIELDLVQECLNLLEAIQVTHPQHTASIAGGNVWNTNRISLPELQGPSGQGHPQGMQFIQQTYLAQGMYSKVRDVLLAVLADFSTAIKDVQNNNKGRGHQRLPDAVLLEDEKGKIYSRKGSSLIQLTAIQPTAFQRLVQIKAEVEICWKRKRTFACSNNTLGVNQESDRINKLHTMRANMLVTFCGRINRQRLCRLEMAVERYTTCKDHLQRVLGMESVAKMTFFQAVFTAIRNHRQDVAREMVSDFEIHAISKDTRYFAYS